LDWFYYSTQVKDSLVLQTPNFNFYKRMQDQPSLESFNYTNLQKKEQKSIRMVMEVKKVLHQQCRGYDGENFELRERISDLTLSCQVMLYPKYMLVNKTSMSIFGER
jgi:hypothetical protein